MTLPFVSLAESFTSFAGLHQAAFIVGVLIVFVCLVVMILFFFSNSMERGEARALLNFLSLGILWVLFGAYVAVPTLVALAVIGVWALVKTVIVALR